MSRRRHPIPGRTDARLGVPAAESTDLQGLARTVEALRQAVNSLIRETGKVEDSATTLGDLIDLGLIDSKDLAKLTKKGSI